MTLAIIGPFFGRHENSLPLLKRLYVDSSLTPDEAWLMGETQEDVDVLEGALSALIEHDMLTSRPAGLYIEHVPTPRTATGKPLVLPYANQINYALNKTGCDLIAYLDNGSMPWITKYQVMADALGEHPEWGAVYCAQKRTGHAPMVAPADVEVPDAFCAVNFTQVMHRWTPDRWPTDLKLGDPDLADAYFWRELHKTLGSFWPVGGDEILDEHDMPSPAALGMTKR